MRFILLILFTCIAAQVKAQIFLEWSDLSEEISLELPSRDVIFPEFQKATFTTKMKALEGKKVVITGYLLVLEGEQSKYLLSQNPMASCFFCGNGGPETVLDLQFAQEHSFEMDDLLSVEGILHLNENDQELCYYRLENANGLRFE